MNAMSFQCLVYWTRGQRESELLIAPNHIIKVSILGQTVIAWELTDTVGIKLLTLKYSSICMLLSDNLQQVVHLWEWSTHTK